MKAVYIRAIIDGEPFQDPWGEHVLVPVRMIDKDGNTCGTVMFPPAYAVISSDDIRKAMAPRNPEESRW